MAHITDVTILGTGIRGLWLGTELKKLGLDVTWVGLREPQKTQRAGGFVFDDWAWQVGPAHLHSKLVQATQDFIDQVLKPKLQEIPVQIVTPQGPFEFSGGAEGRCLRKFFPSRASEGTLTLESYLKAIAASQKLDEIRGSQLLSAHTSKIFKMPLGRRWALEWLGSLRRPRAVNTRDWVLKWGGEVLDPQYPFWLLNDSLHEVTQRAISWAEKRGVRVKRDAKVVDLGVEGRRVMGVELLEPGGFLQTRYLILSCSHQLLQMHASKFARLIKPPLRQELQKWTWIRCGFLLKPGAKSEGLLEFSSYAMDPLMPLVESNFGLIKWRTGDSTDSVTVWVRVPSAELKRRSFLTNLNENVQGNMVSLFPHFSKNLISQVSYEEYVKVVNDPVDDFATVYDEAAGFPSQRCRLKNIWLAGPEFDRGLEMLSQLATEYRLFGKVAEASMKELKRDRAVQSPRNDQNLVHTK